MPSTERSDSRDSDRNLRHQHSSSFDYGRAVVPMWDSSDPERAPPPLPMNPSSPITASRPNTSSAIQAAHSALTEKARENAYVSNALAKRPEPAPERSLIKGATHKRMQSLQTGNVRDLSSFLESNNLNKSPEKSPTRRPSTPHANKDFVLERSLEKENRSSTPTPGRDIPTLRPSLRKPERHQSILGENTPPQSATMMALQNMVSRDTDMPMPLSNVTNGSTALVRAPPTFDAISNQILSLTSIATSLQREMANLTRRSKDNATDLVSLKEATNARDEDIRKSLRELVVNLEEAGSRSASNYLTGASGGLFLDNKAHNSSRSGTIKPFTLPRIPSPNSFASSLDRESTSTPDSATSIALLERILREMGTREGQDLLVSRLTLVADQLSRDGMSTAKKLEDLVRFIKDNTESQALIAHNGDLRSRGFSFDEPPRLELDFDRPRSGPMTQRVEALLSPSNKENQRDSAPVRPSEVLNDDIIKIIRSTKDSVAQGGGLTAEVKALVRELRGEVLGMGREIGRKLEQASTKDASKDAGQSKEDVTHIVEDGLKDLKQHMDGILREHRRQSSESISRNVVDYQEIYNAVRAALNEKPQSPEASSLGKEDIIEAVREAWENYKPDIELQHFGLEREELLAALKEGIQQYTPRESARDVGGATREEVFAAVVEGLKHFSPPRIESEAGLSRDEILDAVRECLEEFEFPAAPSALPREDDVTRDLMLDAVNEGLHKFNFPDKAPISKDVILEAVSEGLQHFQPSTETGNSREVVLDAVHEALQSFELPASSPVSRDVMLDAINEGLNNFDFSAVNGMAISRDIGGSLTRDDLFDAVKAGLEAAPTAMYAYGEQQVYERLQEIIETMRTEFQAVSQEAKQNVAAHGRDTEQLLDATKDGFDRLRNDIETYVDRAADVTGKDEILDCVRESFDALRVEVSALVSKGSESSLDSVQGELEHLRETMATSLVRGGSGIDKDEIIEVLRQGLDGLRADIERPRTSNESFISGTGEILDTLREGFDALRADIDRPRNNENATLGTGEILDALRDGFDALRADIERPRENNQIVLAGTEKSGGNLDKSGEILETLREVSTEIRSVEILDTLREGFDALHAEVNRPRGSNESIMSGTGEILDTLRDGFDALRADIERPRNNNESSTGGTVEILNALQDGLAGLRAEVEKLGSKPVDMTVNYEILDTLKAGLEGVRADIDRLRESGTAKSESNERAVAAITNSAVVPAADGLKRNDIENLEVLITQLRIKIEALESMPPPPPQEVPGAVSKDDLVVGLAALEDLLRNIQESVNGIASQEKTVDEDAPKREDLEAIETLLRNTKAKIDEMDPEQAVTKDHLDMVEAVLRETRDDVNQLASNLQDVSKKDDMGTLESLVREVVVGLEEMKERAVNESEDLEKVTKTDVEAVEAVCHDVKSAIEQMVLSDIAALAAKEDVINLQELLKETTGRIETHAETNAKAFEERQAETVGVGERVTEIKTFLEEFKNAIKEKMDEGSTSVEALSKLLEGLSETLSKNTSTTIDDIKGVLETMKTEFEKSNAGVVGAKLETDEKFQETWDKFDGKLNEKFNELLSKYDDAQASTEELMKIGEAKNAETMEALLGTKAVAEDLKSLIDTLGATLTDSVDKMDEAGKTVFSRVEDTFTRVEETHADAKAEHQLTREQVFKAIEGIERVQGNVTDYHPKILESIKDVLLIVGQHYEHSKTSSSEISQKITDIPPPPPPIELPLLKEPEPVEKYDDTPVHDKLDKLVDHMHAAGKSFAQLDMLDKIHQQVIQTAAEVSEFVTAQTQRIADDHEDKEKAVEAATIVLEKRLAQKEQVEATVVGLREEEDQLKESVAMLKVEQESLAHQKLRLSADVSSLETALRIRREELHAMEARAEGLERRILEGVIDHSRALLISKGKNNGRDAMSRKRVPSHAPSATGSVLSNGNSRANSRASNTTQSAVSMAMNGNRAMVHVPINNPAGASRRILSLNQITNNVPTGGFTRSHSVKAPSTTSSLRKSSWGGSMSRKYGELNKENLALKETEEDEEGSLDEEDEDDEDESDSGTMRRSSLGTTIYTTTGTGVSESIDEGTEWTGSDVGSSVLETPSEERDVVLYDEGAVQAA